MAAETPGSPEDYSLFLSENGHLSFENPNYQVITDSNACGADIPDPTLTLKILFSSLVLLGVIFYHYLN